MEEILLNSAKAAILLNVSEKTLREVLMKIDGFPWMQPAGKGGKILFPRLALEKWANDNWQLLQEA